MRSRLFSLFRKDMPAAAPGGRRHATSQRTVAINLALAANLIDAVRARRRVESGPAAFAPGLFALADVHRGLIQDRLVACAVGIGDARRHQCSAATDAF